MTLDEVITILEQCDQEEVLMFGFTFPHSYRGDYMDLAFEPQAKARIGDMLELAKEALGSTYQGWKGGNYTMTGSTTVWLANEGCTGQEIDVLMAPLALQIVLRRKG